MYVTLAMILLMVHSACTVRGVPLDRDKLRQLQEKSGLKGPAIATALGLAGKSSWSNILTGRQDVTVTQLDAIASLFKVKPAALLSPVKKKGAK